MANQLTGTNIDVTGDDGAHLVLGQTGIRLGMHILTVVLGTERREDEISIGHDLTQTGDIAHRGSIAAHPNDLWRWGSTGPALNLGSGRVRKVNLVNRFGDEDRSFVVSFGVLRRKDLMVGEGEREDIIKLKVQ